MTMCGSFIRPNIRSSNDQAGPLCRQLLHNGPVFYDPQQGRIGRGPIVIVVHGPTVGSFPRKRQRTVAGYPIVDGDVDAWVMRMAAATKGFENQLSGFACRARDRLQALRGPSGTASSRKCMRPPVKGSCRGRLYVIDL
jgi:hypothetical protein